MIRIDLHAHSTCSDGTYSPTELARLAKRSGVSVMALTDHDTVAGVVEFARACGDLGVRAVSGIEISANAPVTTHILGYRMRDLGVVDREMRRIVSQRDERNVKMCAKLREQGVEVDIEEVRAEAGGRVVGRPHFAAVMIRKGYVRDAREAFDRYISSKGTAYVPRESLPPRGCIELIAEAGGVSVLAHPSQTHLDGPALDEMLSELKSFGLWGLECISSHCTAAEALGFLETAARHGLHTTAGSDFHGRARAVSLGVQVTESFLPWGRLGVSL